MNDKCRKKKLDLFSQFKQKTCFEIVFGGKERRSATKGAKSASKFNDYRYATIFHEKPWKCINSLNCAGLVNV